MGLGLGFGQGLGLGLVFGVRTARPAVEGLVHHEHAQPVTRREEGGRHRVVRRADRIVAVGLEQLDSARLGTVDGGGAERAVIVMHTAAAQRDRLAVESKAEGGVPREGADALVRVRLRLRLRV